jgi:hypothetical protein
MGPQSPRRHRLAFNESVTSARAKRLNLWGSWIGVQAAPATPAKSEPPARGAAALPTPTLDTRDR